MKKLIFTLLLGLNAFPALSAMQATEIFNRDEETAIVGDFRGNITTTITKVFSQEVADFKTVGTNVFTAYTEALTNAAQQGSPLKRIYDLNTEANVTKVPPMDEYYPNGKVALALEFFFAVGFGLIDAARSIGPTDESAQRVKAYFGNAENCRALIAGLEQAAPEILPNNWYKRSFRALENFAQDLADQVRDARGPKVMPRGFNAPNDAPIYNNVDLSAIEKRIDRVERSQSHQWAIATALIATIATVAIDQGINTVITLQLPGATVLVSYPVRMLVDASVFIVVSAFGMLLKWISSCF